MGVIDRGSLYKGLKFKKDLGVFVVHMSTEEHTFI